MDFVRATITRDIFIPDPTRPGLSKNRQSTHNFAERISFAEHWKLVAESSEFHFLSEQSACFPTRNTQNKRDILREKRESGMALKSVSLRPKAVVLTPMNYIGLFWDDNQIFIFLVRT